MTAPLFPGHHGRAHDLPPRWDGHPVEWQGWHEQPRALCPSLKADSCSRCGSVAPPLVNRGAVYAAPGSVVRIGLARNGRRHLIGNLHAFRCPDCLGDQVLDDLATGGQWWDLDATDYLDDGSYVTQEALL